MAKKMVRPYPALYPAPLVLVSCLDQEGRPNVLTIAWTGVASDSPPHIAIALRPHRYSHAGIQERGEFTVNVPTVDILAAVDACGHTTGARVDKFERFGLTPLPASQVKPPLIAECPVNLECRVSHQLPLGSHNLIVAQVVALHVDEELLDEFGRIDSQRAHPIVYVVNEYWCLGHRIETSGFTLRKRPSTD